MKFFILVLLLLGCGEEDQFKTRVGKGNGRVPGPNKPNPEPQSDIEKTMRSRMLFSLRDSFHSLEFYTPLHFFAISGEDPTDDCIKFERDENRFEISFDACDMPKGFIRYERVNSKKWTAESKLSWGDSETEQHQFDLKYLEQATKRMASS